MYYNKKRDETFLIRFCGGFHCVVSYKITSTKKVSGTFVNYTRHCTIAVSIFVSCIVDVLSVKTKSSKNWQL